MYWRFRSSDIKYREDDEVMVKDSNIVAKMKKYIVRKIAVDDSELSAKVTDNFNVSMDLFASCLNELLEEQVIAHNEERKCGYQLVEQTINETISLKDGYVDEDYIFKTYISKYLDSCNEQALRIWRYTCAEMLNNAIEHSNGTEISLYVSKTAFSSRVIIVDDGVGVFRSVLEYMKEHGWEAPQVEDALAELYKGKFTTKEANHSGEGIFFSSKMMDVFMLWSDANMYVGGNDRNSEFLKSHLLAYASRIEKIGTMVYMMLENETNRNPAEVFNVYTDIDEGFVKTYIPIKEICNIEEPVSRSQARRICNRLDKFKEVILDFDGVEFMGQGFADELFRVYAIAHPQVLLVPTNMVQDVARMIKHVARGNMPENVRM